MLNECRAATGVCIWCAYFHVDPPPGWEPPEWNPRGKPELRDWWSYGRANFAEYETVAWRDIGGDCRVSPKNERTIGGSGCRHYVDRELPRPEHLANELFGNTAMAHANTTLKEKVEKLTRQRDFARKQGKARLEKLAEAGD